MQALTDGSPELIERVAALCRSRAEWPACRDALRFVVLERSERARAAGRPAEALFAGDAELTDTCGWARTERDPAFRSRAAAACAREHVTDAALLQSLARDPDWRVRARVAGVLASHSREAGAAAVLQLLARDPHPTVRHAASLSRPALS